MLKGSLDKKEMYAHPKYVSALVEYITDDFRKSRIAMNDESIGGKYGVPVGEEIKWSDLWEISKGKYRADFLKSFTPDKLKGYYRRFFQVILP